MKVPNIRLLSDRVLILPIKEEESPSGIILLNKSSKDGLDSFRATVVTVGDDLDSRIVPGDVIYVRGGEGWPLTLEDVDYLVIRETAILAFDQQQIIDPFEAIAISIELAEIGILLPVEDITPLMKRAIKLVNPTKLGNGTGDLFSELGINDNT